MGILSKVVGLGAVASIGTGIYVMTADPDAATVKHVIDGDTISVSTAFGEERVRLLNVDTPEMGFFGSEKECKAQEATDFLKQLLPEGTEIRLEKDVEEEDKYGRILAGVFLGETLVNEKIAAEGLGIARAYEPNTKFYDRVKAAEDSAREKEIGVFDVAENCFFENEEDFNRYQNAVRSTQDTLAEAAVLMGGQNASRLKLASTLRKLDRHHKHVHSILDEAKRNDFYSNVLDMNPNSILSSLDERVKDTKSDLEKASKAAEKEERNRDREEAEEHLDQDTEVEGTVPETGPSLDAPQDHVDNGVADPEPAPAPVENYEPPQPPAAPAPAAPAPDTYTGCRAYGGNYALTSIDDKGRPYAKIDCSTKVQIG